MTPCWWTAAPAPTTPSAKLTPAIRAQEKLGWRLGVDLALHLGNFFVGVGLGLRQLFGVETPLARTWVTDLGLRIGGRIDFSDERAY